MFPYSRVVLVDIELMIGFFSVFKVMKSQKNYMKELYNLDKYKLMWMLCCYFSYFVFHIYHTCIFCSSHEIHFGTTGNSL
jgi:hypothetical protein